MSTIEKTEKYRELLQNCLTLLLTKIGPIQIGTVEQFPYGWRKAAKGRTVWRIIEEAITQNLGKFAGEIGLQIVKPASSEVGIYDCQVQFMEDSQDVYFNIKSAVKGLKVNKDDISKADGLTNFYEDDQNKELFIATFVIAFNEDMGVELNECIVMPITWLPDIYVNPSNNGNLQSSKYKDLANSSKRTIPEFRDELAVAVDIARAKRSKKVNQLIEVSTEIVAGESEEE